jgi:hypothetical protein
LRIQKYLKPFRDYRIEVRHRQTKRWLLVMDERCPFRARKAFDGWAHSYPDVALRLLEIPTRRVLILRQAPD